MKQILIIIVFGLLFTNFAFCNDTLTMVYRTTAKEPYIKKQPSNQGIWESVYKEAAKKIGLKLEVQRYPKKRAYKMLEEGDVDFYPAASFKKSREKIGYFINSQLKRDGFAVIYRDDLEINNIKDIKGYELLNNLGSTYTFYNRAGIDIKNNTMRQIPELDIQRAVKILQNKMGDIYAYSNIGVKNFSKITKLTKLNY
ncbi:MAG: transporter substrate-binding domain-containing protein [Campylobacterota bacterium]|nr:transporter substrate-binding domain-containing protein [Campylobacterota bacterium]